MIFFGEVLAARLLKDEAYGLYASGITVARIGEVVAVFGLPVGIFHYLPIYRKTSQTPAVLGIVYAACLLPLLIGSAFAIGVWTAAPWLARHVFKSEEVVRYLRLLVMAVPFMATTEILGALTRGFGFAKYYVVIKNLIPPTVFLTSLGLMAAFHAQPLWIVAAVTSGSMIASAAGVLAIMRITGEGLWRVRSEPQFGTLYKYA